MGELKSAWEIAMEKAEKLGRLSPEELQMHNQERYALVGRALAEKYLAGLDARRLDLELDKYNGEEKATVSQVVLSRLIEAIELGNYERLKKIAEAIFLLKQDSKAREMEETIKGLFDEYVEAEQEQEAEIERRGREILRQLGISGGAIAAINPRTRDEWQQSLDGITQAFHEKLNQLNQELIP